MARHQFRLFGNLSFLQSIDKERILSQLLAPHRDYFARQKIDVDRLANDEPCVRLLLSVFTHSDETMPGDLLRDLYLIDRLGDEDGQEMILEEAAKIRIDLRSLPDDISPGDFALLVLLEHPKLVRICHEKTVAKQVKRYYEYRSHDKRRFTTTHVKAGVPQIKAVLGPWFEARKRTAVCELFIYREGHEVRILITHGGLFRADGNVTGDNVTGHLELSRLPWRPQKHDSIVYDMKSGILKIHATYEAERKAYREALGERLAGNVAFFVNTAPYTLEPLRTNGGTLTLVDGLDSARLTEALLETDDPSCRQILVKGDNVMETLSGSGAWDVPPGEIAHACFSLRYTSGGRPRKLEVRLPNVADYDRERDGEVTEAFIHANGFLADVHDDPHELVDPD